MKKTILTIIAMLLLGTNAFAQPKDLHVQQQKVNQIKQTQQGKEIFRLVDKYSKQYNVDSKYIHSIILVESGYNPKVTSPCNAKGLMQLMDGTFHARKVGSNPYSMEQNIHAGVKHYRGMVDRYHGNNMYALAAYNAGGARIIANKPIPSYAKAYAEKVMYYKNGITF